MNKIYAWSPSFAGNIGHAALDISFGQGAGRADYVSWWPAESINLKSFRSLPGDARTFPSDCHHEGGLPGAAVEVRCLDEDRMRARWGEIQRRGNYSLYFHNCAATVADVLRAGGAALSADVRWFIESHGSFLWMPADVIRLARWINNYSSAIEQQRAQGWKPEDYNFAYLSKLHGA